MVWPYTIPEFRYRYFHTDREFRYQYSHTDRESRVPNLLQEVAFLLYLTVPSPSRSPSLPSSLPLSPLPQSSISSSQSSLSTTAKSSQVDHWPALPSPSPIPPGGQWATGKLTTKADWGGVKEDEQDSVSCEEDLLSLMKSLDIMEHLHVLQVHSLTYHSLLSLDTQACVYMIFGIGIHTYGCHIHIHVHAHTQTCKVW